MPFPRPTLTALRTQAMQDITASDLPNADGFLRRSALRVLAWVQAGLAYLHYGYLDWISKQSVPYTATGEFLEAWAALAPTPVYRLAPSPATCPQVTFTAITTTPPVVIPPGTLMYRSDLTQYQTTAAGTAVGGVVTVAIAAVVAGSAGNADAGTALSLSTVIAGVTTSSGIAVTAIGGGTDLELDASLTSRMLESYANPPSGGSSADYVTWALEVPGVTRAWTRANGMGPGSVVVYFMEDVAEAAHNGFPQGTNGVATGEARASVATGDQLAVANWIYPLQPVTALVYAAAPIAQPVNFTLTGLSSISGAQQALVKSAIAATLVALGSPLAAAPGIQQSQIQSAIAAIAGLPNFAVTAPTVWPITPAVGSLLTLGVVTFA